MKNMKKLLFGIIMMFAIAMIAPGVLPKEIGTTEVQAAVTVGTPRLVSATQSGKTAAVVRWNAVSGANGYRIYRRGAGETWKAVKNVGKSTVAYKDTGLVPGKLYAYTVRAYKKVGGKNYWSGYNRTGVRVVAARSYLKLNKTSATVYLGKYCTLKLNGTNLKPTWKSSNTSIATVNSAGKVTPKKAGTVTITASLSGLRFSCKVKATHYITPLRTSVTVAVGQTTNVAINSSYSRIYYGSDNSSIAYASGQTASTSNYLLGIRGMKVGTTRVIIQNAQTNPTMRRVINVTVVSSATSVANKNKNSVAAYITKYGKTDSSGNKYIRHAESIDGTACVWTVTYQPSKNRLYFLLSTNDGEAKSATAMGLSMSTTSVAPSAYVVVGSSAGFKASSKIYLSSYTTSSNLAFSITESVGLSSSYLNSDGVNLANAELKLGFIGWDFLLRSKTSFSMKDIGFAKYA